MRRREFIALVGGVALPIKVSAQHSAMPVIGFLGSAASQEYDSHTSNLERFKSGTLRTRLGGTRRAYPSG